MCGRLSWKTAFSLGVLSKRCLHVVQGVIDLRLLSSCLSKRDTFLLGRATVVRRPVPLQACRSPPCVPICVLQSGRCVQDSATRSYQRVLDVCRPWRFLARGLATSFRASGWCLRCIYRLRFRGVHLKVFALCDAGSCCGEVGRFEYQSVSRRTHQHASGPCFLVACPLVAPTHRLASYSFRLAV